jgi:signal peptidase I
MERLGRNDAMAPTLRNGDTVVIHKWDSSVSGALARGDIIVFRNPANDDVVLLKRLIGLPNDELRVSNGTVFVNGDRLAEPYVLYPATYTYPPDGQGRTVPAGNYFVLGDNREQCRFASGLVRPGSEHHRHGRHVHPSALVNVIPRVKRRPGPR